MSRTAMRVVFVCVLAMAPVEPVAAQPATGSRIPPTGSAQERLYDVVLTSIIEDGSAIVMASSRQKQLAKDFLAFLKKPEAVRQLRAFGFTPPEAK